MTMLAIAGGLLLGLVTARAIASADALPPRAAWATLSSIARAVLPGDDSL